MRVAEKFISINGEGTRAGELAVFVRFTGCNLCCSYCDTMWANEPGCPFEETRPAPLSGREIITMDWLNENIEGTLPDPGELTPKAKAFVEASGVHKP